VIGHGGGYELQAEAEDHAKFVVAGIAAHLLPATKINPLPTGFVLPAQPVLASRPPIGTDWVRKIKHDGYRMIVRRDGPSVWLYSGNAYNWTARLAAIAAAAKQIKAESFTIDGEAVVLGPDELSRQEADDTNDPAHPRPQERPAIAQYWRPLSESTNTSPRTGLSSSRTPAGLAQKDRLQPCRRQLSIRSLSGLDQGPQSRQHRRAAGEDKMWKR
jgi:hypothetical protein